jgi:hypothetical protein
MKFQIMVTAAVAMSLLACNNESDKTAENTDTSTSSNTVTSTTVQQPVKTEVKTVEIPTVAKTSFEAKYPQASDVVWSRYNEPPMDLEWEWYGWPALDTNDYVGTWTVNNYPYWVWYDDQGNWVGSIETINISSVPDAVNRKLNTEFSGYTVASVNKENDKNRVAYEIKLTKGDDNMKVLIDEKGNVMKKKGTVNGEKVKEKNI